MTVRFCNRCEKETRHSVVRDKPAWKRSDWCVDRASTSDLIDYANGDVAETHTCDDCGNSFRVL